jgi:hypothetical protein
MSRAQKYLTLRGAFSRLSVTSFSQGLGAELLTNGNFALWASGDPTGWTEVGESGTDPEITEVDPGNLHGAGGNGAANLFSSATANNPRLSQSVATTAMWHEFACDITAFGSGGIRLTDGGLSGVTYGSVRTFKRLFLAANTAATITMLAASGDLTIDNASLKAIVMNAQQSAAPFGTFDFRFTPPGTTYAGQLIGLPYRISSPSNFLLMYLLRNATNAAWDIRLDSYANNAATNLRAVTGVGDPDTIRVVVGADNSHQLYTGVAGTFTARGVVVSSALYSGASGINTIYSPDTTPLELLAVA